MIFTIRFRVKYADKECEEVYKLLRRLRKERIIMAYSVVSGSYINRLYGDYRSLASGSQRASASNKLLVTADSAALKRGTTVMSRLDFGSADETDSSVENKLFYNNFRAFMDTLNNTLSSSSSSENSDIKRLSKEIKKLSKDYEEKLSKLGISISDSGYWSVDKETFEAIDNKKFEEIFGEDSDFSSSVKKLAKRLIRHVNAWV